MSENLEHVDPNSLQITHIFDGEEIITGGNYGEIYIATFASRRGAEQYVEFCKANIITIFGERRNP